MSFDLKITAGDLVIAGGDLKTVVDSEKLIQDILKLCLTSAGTNPLAPWYGSFISRTLIGSALDTSMLIQISKSQLNTALENLKGLQQLQIKSFQYVSADEQIGAILDISVVRNQIDPRVYMVSLKVMTKGLKPITAAFRLSTI